MNKDNKIVIKKAVSDNVISQYKEKNSKQISINININNNSFKTFDSSNTKTYKEEEKNSKILNKENKIKENPNHTPINKEPEKIICRASSKKFHDSKISSQYSKC